VGGILAVMTSRRPGQHPEAEFGEEDREIRRLRDVGSTKSKVAERVWEVEHVRGQGEAEVRRVASRQRGVILREQLIAAGIGRGAIERRLANGSLVFVHRGVYLVGHDALAPYAKEMAAALRYRGRAVLSHRTAAAVWHLLPQPSNQIELTIAGSDARSYPGVHITRVNDLDRRDFRWRDGLPVTSPARTMIDLAGCLDDELELERVLAEFRVRSLLRDSELRAAIARCPNRKGVALVNSMLDSEHEPALTRSKAERLMRRICDQAQLPRPIAGARPCGFPVDFFWPAARLVVEVDGLKYHGHRRAFENDRRRDQILVAAGFRVVRVTWRQLTHQPVATIVRVAQAMVVVQPATG
jgi:hypothetical protein